MRIALLASLLVLAIAAPASAVTITEFEVNSASLRDIATGPDGNQWFTKFDDDAIGRMAPDGTWTEFHGTGANAVTGPLGITAGPDGNLWFTEPVEDQIGRITPAGDVTLFSGLAPGSQPSGIAAGAGGALWFTEPAVGQIGRITTSGVVSEFSDGLDGFSTPMEMASGPDGNVWFVDPGHQGVGFVTPAGVATEFEAGISPHNPQDITPGPDGAMWFTEGNGDQVARITFAGVVTEFSAGISDEAFPDGITAGPDGNLWFAEPGTASVARITPAGVVTEFKDEERPDAEPVDISLGADSRLWFTDTNYGSIGRIALDDAPPPPPATVTPTPTVTPPEPCAPGPPDADGDGIPDACETLPSGSLPPVAGVRVRVRLVSGRVFVQLPPGASTSVLGTGWHAFTAAGFEPLAGSASLPVGTVVDARKGALGMTAAATAKGKLAAATLRAGIFRIRQQRAKGRAKRPVDLVLASRATTAKACAAGNAPRKGVVRSVSVVAKGLYRAVGAAATATATKASFTTQDRCTGTVTRVSKGRVKVHDARKHKTVTVKAGHTYLAKARLFGARKKRR
jgi:streptogramin lyase